MSHWFIDLGKALSLILALGVILGLLYVIFA